MDGGEARRTVRCTGGAQDKTIINRIMLRFRPIAPKPVNGDLFPCHLPVVNKNLLVTNSGSKRKYVRVRKNKGYRRKRKLSASDHQEHKEGSRKDNVVTLQLLPEKADPVREQPMFRNKAIGCLDHGSVEENNRSLEMGLMSFKNNIPVMGLSDQTVVESWVTVECVTGACIDSRDGLGITDAERVRSLEVDTCPGFVSDGLNRVQWVNGAYKRMLRMKEGNGDGVQPPETKVWVVMKEELPWLLYGAFTCRVRLQYSWLEEKYSRTVPCDVWRLDCGGFAWRLDVEAALSLGR